MSTGAREAGPACSKVLRWRLCDSLDESKRQARRMKVQRREGREREPQKQAGLEPMAPTEARTYQLGL